ncbi:TPA: PKD domain-containing protein [Candidatus Gracilibacteria bacterium]|nr:PKD domain-containing protein [Candidatus Gracilibacteria bacterium]
MKIFEQIIGEIKKIHISFTLALASVLFSLVLFSVFNVPSINMVQAAGFDITRDPCEGKESCLNYLENDDLPDAIQTKDDETLTKRVIKLINQILLYMGLALTIIVIYAGIIIIFSFGDSSKRDDAKNMIINAIIGIVIIILSYSIVYTIGFILKKDPIENAGSEGTTDGSGTDGTESGSGTTGTRNADGTISVRNADGTISVRNADGTISIRNADGTISVRNADGTIGTREAAARIGTIDRKIEELEGTFDKLKNDNRNGKNNEEIAFIEGTIGGLKNEKANILENDKINTIKEEIALLDKNNVLGGANNTNTEELTALKKELVILQDRKESGVFDTSSELEKILNEVHLKENVDIKKLESIIEDLRQTAGNNIELLKKINILQNLLNELDIDPSDSSSLKKIENSVKEIKAIKNTLIEIKPVIIISSSRAYAPTTITLSAEKTVVKDGSPSLLNNDSYHWSVVGPDGIKQNIGNGITRTFTINIPGRYIFSLRVNAAAKNVIAGLARKAITVGEPETESLFMIGGKTMNETIEFTQEQNNEGIIFNPSFTKPKIGRVITKYIWNFSGVKKEENAGKSVLYSFPKEGKHKVSLIVEDNLGERTKSKEVQVEIKKIVSYFKLEKPEYELGEIAIFKGGKSVSSGGFIQEYDWKILNSNGELIAEFQSQDCEYSFDTPNEYFVKLTVTDAEGRISTSSKSFMVIAENPKPKFSIKNTLKANPAQRLFDAKKSSDPSESKLKYSWDFDGDGIFEKTNLENPQIEHIFEEAKEYTIILKVENAFGKTEKITKKVNIKSILSLQLETKSLVNPMNEEIEFTVVSNEGKAFEWNFGDGSKKVITSETAVTHAYAKSGRYMVTVSATDENEKKITVKKSIFIGLVDTPTAAISLFVDGKRRELDENVCGSGKDGIEIFRSQKIEFSAEESVNKDGKSSSLKYNWKFPLNANELDKKVLWKFKKISEPGKCEEIILWVMDERSSQKSSEEKVYIYVKNTSPEIIKFEAQKSKTNLSPLSVSLSMNAKDLDGKIMKYSWWVERKNDEKHEKIGYHTTQAKYTTLTIPSYGKEGDVNEYSFFGSVTDNDDMEVFTVDDFGKIAPVFVKTDKNRLPEVKIIPSSTKVLLGDTVTFTILAQTKEGVDIAHLAEYTWDFDNDNIFDKTTQVNKVSHKYHIAGAKTIRVKVLYQGLVISKLVEIEVEKISKLPLAKFGIQKSGVLPEEILFNAEESIYDQSISGNAIEYIWDIDINNDSDGDGNPANDVDYTKAVFTHLYPRGQMKSEILLQIKDAQGAEDTISRKVNFNKLSGVIININDDAIENNTSLKPLISELSSEKIDKVQTDIDIALEEGNTVSVLELEEISNLIHSLDGEVVESDYLYENVQDVKKSYLDLSKDPNNPILLLKLKESIARVQQASSNYNLSKWKPLGLFSNNINSSLIINASSPSSYLNLYGGEALLKEGEEIDIFAFIQNIDGSLYSGDVSIKVVEGRGTFFSKNTKSIDGRAIFTFVPTELGVITLQVEAKDTLPGPLREQLQFIIQE